MFNIVLRRYAKFTTWSWHNLDRWITILGWTLGIGAVLHHIILIYVLPWGSRVNYMFGQTQVVMFLALTSVVAITYARVPKHYSVGYRWASCILLLAQLLTLTAVVLEVTGPDKPAYSAIGLLLYFIIHLCSVWGLAPLLPWRTLPRSQMLRLGAETSFVLALVHLVFQLILPVVFDHWTATPLVIAAQFRLTGSVGLCFWYIEAYRRFGEAHRRFVILAACGLFCMFVNDVTLLWAIVEVEAGASGKLIRATSVIWTLQQVFWVLALYWVVSTPMRWNAGKRLRETNNQISTWFSPARQGLVLIALVIVASIISPSFITTLWLGTALISREAVVIYERERAQQQLTAYTEQAVELGIMRGRERLSRDIHDSTGSTFSRITYIARVGISHLGTNEAEIRNALLQIVQEADAGIEDVRRAVRNLRDTTTLQRSLPELIRDEIERVKPTGLNARLESTGEPYVVPPHVTAELWRIVQESFTNVRRHAQATEVIVYLDYRPNKKLNLTIEDNGQGCDLTTVVGGFGIQSMEERAKQIGTELIIWSRPGHGLQIHVEVPL